MFLDDFVSNISGSLGGIAGAYTGAVRSGWDNLTDWVGSATKTTEQLQHDSQDFNAKQADIAYQRQKELRNTEYTDMVQSMRDAGLNPALLLSHGSGGASTPSVATGGSSGGARGFDMRDALGVLSSLLGSAVSVARVSSQAAVSKMNAAANLGRSDAALTNARSSLRRADASLTSARAMDKRSYWYGYHINHIWNRRY